MTTTTKLAEIVAMLVEVARAAHYAMDDCGDLLLTEDGAEKLSNALDALDELPEIDDGYVRDGWCKAKDWLIALDATTPQPSADAVRELVKRILNWQPLTSINKADRLYQILIAAGIPFESVTDELESLLSAASDNQQNAAQGGGEK